MYSSKITPANFKPASENDVLELTHELQEVEKAAEAAPSPPETVARKGKGLLRKAFSKQYVHLPVTGGILAVAAMVKMTVAMDHYLEDKYSVRNDWTLPSSCEVWGDTPSAHFSYAAKGSNDPAATIVRTGRDAMLACETAMNKPGFKFQGMHLVLDFRIKNMRGFDGQIDSSIAGFSSAYGPNEESKARKTLDKASYVALQHQMRLIGRENTYDWYLYKALTAQKNISEWSSEQWQIAKNKIANSLVSTGESLKSSHPQP